MMGASYKTKKELKAAIGQPLHYERACSVPSIKRTAHSVSSVLRRRNASGSPASRWQTV